MNNQPSKIPLLALCLSFFVVILDTSVVNVALPTLQQQLHCNLHHCQWVLVGYTLSFAACLLLAGQLTDRLGAKKILLAGLAGFLAASLGCAIANSISQLIVFRVFQGMSATLLLPASMVVIRTLYTSTAQRQRAIGIWASTGGIAAASGPLIGGYLTAKFGWPSIFLINVPIILTTLVLSLTHVHIKQQITNHRINYSAHITLCLIIASFAFMVMQFDQWSTQPVVLSLLLAATLTMITALFFQQRKQSHPLVAKACFQQRSMFTALACGVVINVTFYGTLFIMPMYFHHIDGFNTLDTGLVTIPLMFFAFISSYAAGKLASKYGERVIVMIGLSLATLGSVLLAITCLEGASYLAQAISLALIGFGSAFTMPAATSMAVHAVSAEHSGTASSLFNLCRQFGSVIGVAIFGSALMLLHSYHSGTSSALIIAASLLIATAAYTARLHATSVCHQG